MSLLDNLNKYHKKPENASPKGRINLTGTCFSCGTNAPLNTGLFKFLPAYVELAPHYRDRVGKDVCFSCLPPQVQTMMLTSQNQFSNTVTASKKNSYIDELFAEIFKSEK